MTSIRFSHRLCKFRDVDFTIKSRAQILQVFGIEFDMYVYQSLIGSILG